MTPPERADTYAAVDLGSNSFHLLVARREFDELRVIDRIKETVRLGGGLDREGRLDKDTQQRALSCLARFGQRLRGIPADNIRAVGTHTFRRLKDANAFLVVAETALCCSIDIIGGREEARLIYLGVSQGVSGHQDRRLVIDIGGGSTELVIGQGLQPIEMESVQYGCVSLTRRYFADGRITARRWHKAVERVMADLQELRSRYLETGWQTVIGSSGTTLSINEICRQMGWVEKDIDAAAINRLRDKVLGYKTVQDMQLPGLSEDRQEVLIGGLAILYACFRVFALDSIKTSPYALREGVLHDLLGRMENRDPRENTIRAFRARYGVDQVQVERVRKVALDACRQIQQAAFLRPVHLQLLSWAADLHEVGLGVAHSHYQEHSGYLVQNSDMTGFTQQEQQFLAVLTRCHRRAIPRDFARSLPGRLMDPLRFTLFCLRFACILCRTRDDLAIPGFRLQLTDHQVSAQFPPQWLQTHPLTLADLRLEEQQLRQVGLQLAIADQGKAHGQV
jgi:exopolyphosphatase/guanosine-5'-triphosphate,3'-diphosphate pyrophosphatase